MTHPSGPPQRAVPVEILVTGIRGVGQIKTLRRLLAVIPGRLFAGRSSIQARLRSHTRRLQERRDFARTIIMRKHRTHSSDKSDLPAVASKNESMSSVSRSSRPFTASRYSPGCTFTPG